MERKGEKPLSKEALELIEAVNDYLNGQNHSGSQETKTDRSQEYTCPFCGPVCTGIHQL